MCFFELLSRKQSHNVLPRLFPITVASKHFENYINGLNNNTPSTSTKRLLCKHCLDPVGTELFYWSYFKSFACIFLYNSIWSMNNDQLTNGHGFFKLQNHWDFWTCLFIQCLYRVDSICSKIASDFEVNSFALMYLTLRFSDSPMWIFENEAI